MKQRLRTAILFAALLVVFRVTAATIEYPETKKVEQTDTYAGSVVVADPYRWLENDVRQSEEVRGWVEAQNEVTFSYLGKLPGRQKIKDRLSAVWDYAKQTVPQKKGGRYFFRRNDGLQNQSVLYMQKSPADTPQVLIDPNTWSKDGTEALGGFSASEDGRYLAYSRAEAGSDWTVWRIRDLETGQDLPDEIRWVKFSFTSWTKDSKGFFYSRFPEPQKGAAFQGLNLDQRVFYHRAGTPQAEDVLVHEDADHPDWSYSPQVTEDGRYLVLTTSKGTAARYRVLYRDLAEPYGTAVTLIDKFENEYAMIGNDGPVFYFKTDLDAPRGRVVAIDIRNPDRAHWKEILPQTADNLADVSLVGGRFIAEYLKDARALVKVFDREGKAVREVDLGVLGSASGFEGDANDSETFFSVESFTVAPSVYRYDVATGEKTLFFRAEVKGVDPNQFEVKQVFYTSKDGTKVPMFLAYRKGLKLDGNNPTLLYGYGGFNIAQKPAFRPARLVWMQMGGVFALANLRGGGEYGAEWHKAGTKLVKQNTFDDFIAAGEWLVSNKYTSPKKLAIQGGSNGGLLVGAAMTQRPDLFGAALPAVGVMDMLRFHRFTAGRYWTDDYGSSDNADEFKVLYGYSPYHNLKKGVRYPATLVTTADTDDRVVPGHSFKFAAALQEAQSSPAPVLIRIETRAGHGGGKPTAKIIEEVADQWAFLAANLGIRF